MTQHTWHWLVVSEDITSLVTSAISYSGPPSMCVFSIREKIGCVSPFFGVFLCGFWNPLTPSSLRYHLFPVFLKRQKTKLFYLACKRSMVAVNGCLIQVLNQGIMTLFNKDTLLMECWNQLTYTWRGWPWISYVSLGWIKIMATSLILKIFPKGCFWGIKQIDIGLILREWVWRSWTWISCAGCGWI